MTAKMGVEEVDLYRSLKKTAIVLMLLLRLDGPTGENEIASTLAMSATTVRNHLRALARLGVITRTHRYQGWVLTAGGRQMILGESNQKLLAENVPIEQALEEEGIEIIASDKNCRSTEEVAQSSVKNCRSSVKNCRSRPVAAASLILSFKEEKDEAAAAQRGASAKNWSSSDRMWRSLKGRRIQRNRNGKRAAKKMEADCMVEENLAAFAAIGLAKNDFVLEICKMKHVNPRFIFGQKKRLESERRYSPGLLLTVVRCNDYLPKRYLPRIDLESQFSISEIEPATEEEPEKISKIEADPSIHEPLSENGMTPLHAWSAALRQVKVDMSRVTYDKWVRGTMLLCARDGLFVIGTPSDYARDWLASRLASTIGRLLTGICNKPLEAKFVDLNDESAALSSTTGSDLSPTYLAPHSNLKPATVSVDPSHNQPGQDINTRFALTRHPG